MSDLSATSQKVQPEIKKQPVPQVQPVVKTTVTQVQVQPTAQTVMPQTQVQKTQPTVHTVMLQTQTPQPVKVETVETLTAELAKVNVQLSQANNQISQLKAKVYDNEKTLPPRMPKGLSTIFLVWVLFDFILVVYGITNPSNYSYVFWVVCHIIDVISGIIILLCYVGKKVLIKNQMAQLEMIFLGVIVLVNSGWIYIDTAFLVEINDSWMVYFRQVLIALLYLNLAFCSTLLLLKLYSMAAWMNRAN